MTDFLADMRMRAQTSPMLRRFAGGAAWSVFGAIISSGLSLLLLILVAQILGKSGYGQFVLLQSSLATVALLAGFGTGNLALRYVAELRQRDPARLARVLGLAIRCLLAFAVLATLLVMVVAEPIALRVLSSFELYRPLLLAAPAILFLAIDGYQKSILIGLESMRALTGATMAGSLLGVPVMLYAAQRYGLEGAAAALTINAAVQALCGGVMLRLEMERNGIRGSASGWWKEHPLIGSYAFPALIGSALVGPAHWAVQAILAARPDGFAQVAALGVALQWFNVVMFIPGNAGRVVMPILTDRLSGGDQRGSRRILISAMVVNAIVAVPLAFVLIALSPRVVALYGAGFGSDTGPFVLAVATAALLAVIGPVGTLMSAAARMWLAAWSNAAWAAVYVGLTYLVLGQNAGGVTLALAIAYLTHSVWTLGFARRHLRSVNESN